MHLVDRMIQSPPNCMICGAGNTPDGQTGEIGPFLDLERDVNWGDSTYLCGDCSCRIGAMFGMISLDERKDLDRRVKSLGEKIHDLQADIELRRRREQEAVRRARGVEALMTK